MPCAAAETRLWRATICLPLIVMHTRDRRPSLELQGPFDHAWLCQQLESPCPEPNRCHTHLAMPTRCEGREAPPGGPTLWPCDAHNAPPCACDGCVDARQAKRSKAGGIGGQGKGRRRRRRCTAWSRAGMGQHAWRCREQGPLQEPHSHTHGMNDARAQQKRCAWFSLGACARR